MTIYYLQKPSLRANYGSFDFIPVYLYQYLGTCVMSEPLAYAGGSDSDALTKMVSVLGPPALELRKLVLSGNPQSSFRQIKTTVTTVVLIETRFRVGLSYNSKPSKVAKGMLSRFKIRTGHEPTINRSRYSAGKRLSSDGMPSVYAMSRSPCLYGAGYHWDNLHRDKLFRLCKQNHCSSPISYSWCEHQKYGNWKQRP